MLSVLPPDQEPGEPIRRLLAQSLALFPDFCARLQHESGIDPQYWVCGGSYIRNNGARTEYPQLAQIRNPRLLRALAETLRRRGVQILEHTEVLGWREHGGVLTGVRTATGDICCGAAVLAAGAWSAALGAEGVAPAKGQMLLLRAQPGDLPKILIGEDVYLIPRRDGLILAGSTVENVGFDTTPTAAARQLLLERGTQLWPQLAQLPVEQHWAGLRPRAAQDQPLLGPHPQLPGLYLATGHFRIGLTLSPATALQISALLGAAVS